MKRIAIFTTAYLPFLGGAEVAVREITKRLSDIHFDVYTARLDRKLPEVEEISKNVTIYRIGGGYFWDKFHLAFWGHKNVLENHKKDSYDMAWAIMASFGGLSARNFKKAKPEVPFLLTLQEGDDLLTVERKGKFMLGAFKDIFEKANKVQAISEYLAKWAKLKTETEVKVIPNGVDLAVFRVRKKLPKNSRPIIVTASRLVTKNGVADLIRAFSYLKKSAELWIIGSGGLDSELRSLVKRLDVEKNVKFFGQISHEDLVSCLEKADVFVRPSLSEGLGNAFLEAMAVGVPIIGTRVGGIPDFLTEGETGWFCQVNDPTDLVRKLEFVLDPKNRKEIQEVVDRARKLVEKKYDWDTIALQFRNLFDRMSIR